MWRWSCRQCNGFFPNNRWPFGSATSSGKTGQKILVLQGFPRCVIEESQGAALAAPTYAAARKLGEARIFGGTQMNPEWTRSFDVYVALSPGE